VGFLKKLKFGLYWGLVSTAALLLLLCRDKVNVMRQDRLVVYNISRHSVIERIQGKYVHPITIDTSRVAWFATKPAHTGWGAWTLAKAQESDCFKMKGKKILLLKAPNTENDTAAFPIDVLIVSCSLKALNPQRLQQAYHPEIIIADGIQPRWIIRKWIKDCSDLKIPFHAVGKDGAFTLE
jgi:hypothetical protein